MPETPTMTYVNENTTVVDYNDDNSDYTLPASTLVTNNYPDVWLDEGFSSESEAEASSQHELNPPSDYDYKNEKSESDVSECELPPPVLTKPTLMRTVAIGAGVLDNTHASQSQDESDGGTEYDSDGDVIMRDVE